MLEWKHHIQCKVLGLLKSLTHLLSSNSYGIESTLSAEDGMNLFLDAMELMQLKVHDHIMFVFLKKHTHKPSSAKYIKGKAGMEYTYGLILHWESTVILTNPCSPWVIYEQRHLTSSGGCSGRNNEIVSIKLTIRFFCLCLYMEGICPYIKNLVSVQIMLKT